MNNLASLRRRVGQYPQAEVLLHKAIDMIGKAVGERDPQFASSLSSLASVYQDLGKYGDAQQLFRQALIIRVTSLGPEHPLVAESWDNLATIYVILGLSERAEALYLRASTIWQAAFGDDSPDRAINLSGLSNAYGASGKYRAAEAAILEAIRIFTKVYGDDHPDVAIALHNLASRYEDLGKYSELEDLAQRSLRIRRRYFGEQHPQVARALHSLGRVYWLLGKCQAAAPILREAIDLALTTLGAKHPDLSDMLTCLANVEVALGHPAEAMSLFERVNSIDDHLIGQIFPVVSEAMRISYLETLHKNFEVFLTFLLEGYSKNTRSVTKAVDMVLRRKTIVAEAWAIQRDVVLGGEHPNLVSKLLRLTELRRQIAQMILAGPGEQGIEQYQQRLSPLIGDREILEAELAREIPEINLAESLHQADHRAVANAIPDEAVLIEFLRTALFDFKAVGAKGERAWRPMHYIAFVLHRDTPETPDLIDLGESEAIDRQIRLVRGVLTGESERGIATDTIPAYAEEAGRLRETLFDPLTPFFRSKARLLIAPDGELNRLPFEILPSASGRHLIDDYRISYLSVGRDLLRFKTAPRIR